MSVKIVWRVEIPGHVTRVNVLLKGHWRTGHRRVKADKRMVALACAVARVPEAAGKRRVSLEVVLGPRQRADEDCWFKVVLDCLVACRRLRSDDRTWCELGPVTHSRGARPAMTILLEDIT